MLAIAAIVFFFLWRRRQRRAGPAHLEQPQRGSEKGPPAIHQGPVAESAYEPNKWRNVHEAGASNGAYGTRENVELDGTNPRQELIGSDPPVELPNDGYGYRP